MSIEISNLSNVYKVKGTLNKRNVSKFEREFENALERFDNIVLNIQNLETVDKHGVKAFAHLQQMSNNQKKQLSIIGSGCESLYKFFKTGKI